MLLLLGGLLTTNAQVGGKYVYNFLNISYSSRLMGLGGNLISVHDNDPTLLFTNPSYISERQHNVLALNYTDYFTTTNAISAAYSYTFPKAGRVVYVRGTTEVDAAKLGANPSGLKLTYKAKGGTFKGSFKVYADNGGRLKATTVNVTGVLIDGVGHGTATCRRPAFTLPVTIR